MALKINYERVGNIPKDMNILVKTDGKEKTSNIVIYTYFQAL